MKDIHNNLPLIQPNFLTFLDWFLIIVIIGILIWVYISFFYISKKEKKEYKKKKTIFKPSKFSFQKELKKLEKSIQKENWKEFSIQATYVLKLLLEKKYQQYFLFATGKELQEILSHKKIIQIQKDQLKDFFEILDPIKFAHQKGKLEQSKKIIETLKDFYK